MGQPDLNAFFDQLCSAGGWDFGALIGGGAIGLVCGTNPPWGSADFFTIYPKFAGSPNSVTGDLTSGSPVVANTTTAGLSAGQLVTGTGIPAGTLILSVDSGTQFTMSQNSTMSQTASVLSVFSSPLLPMAVINVYIALASASLVQARWQDSWYLAMALYTAHFCTLWLRSEGNTGCSAGAAAAAGLARGIQTSKGVGPANVGITPVAGLEQWGAWTQTEYGVQLATFAKIVGMGPILVL